MIDTESGETAPLKPTTGQKTRGLTALVVACAALSFFAGAAATNGLLRTAVAVASRVTIAGPTSHTTRRVVGQWGGAGGAICEDHFALAGRL